MLDFKRYYENIRNTLLNKSFLLPSLLSLLLVLGGCGSSSDTNEPPPGNNGEVNGDTGGDDTGGGDAGGDDAGGDDAGGKRDLTGAAQKGPFQVGSTARLWQLSNGEIQGQAMTLTLSQRGNFQFKQAGMSGPVLAEVQGRFFDEISGNFSAEELTLRAVLNLSEQSNHANINLLTHLIHKRMLNELADGKSYQAALDNTLLEYELLTGGLIMPPHELDLLMAKDGSVNPLHLFESAELLLFSAAATELTQTQLNALSEGFATNGSEDEDARAVWAAIGQGLQRIDGQASAGHSGAAALQQRLLDNYPMPNGLESYDIDEVLRFANSPSKALMLQEDCESGRLEDSDNIYRLCYGEDLVINTNKHIVYVAFKFPYAGSYRLEMKRDPGSQGKINYIRQNRIDDTTTHESCESWGGTCRVSTSNRNSGAENFLLLAASDAALPYSATLRAIQISEGTSSSPMLLSLERRAHKTQAGIEYSNPSDYRGGMDSSNNLNHYLFWLSSPATGKRLIIDDFACRPGAREIPISFHLAKEETNEVIVKSKVPNSNCELYHEFEEGDEGLYYLRVHQERGLKTAPYEAHETSTTYRFNIRLE